MWPQRDYSKVICHLLQHGSMKNILLLSAPVVEGRWGKSCRSQHADLGGSVQAVLVMMQRAHPTVVLALRHVRAYLICNKLNWNGLFQVFTSGLKSHLTKLYQLFCTSWRWTGKLKKFHPSCSFEIRVREGFLFIYLKKRILLPLKCFYRHALLFVQRFT